MPLGFSIALFQLLQFMRRKWLSWNPARFACIPQHNNNLTHQTFIDYRAPSWPWQNVAFNTQRTIVTIFKVFNVKFCVLALLIANMITSIQSIVY